MLSFSENFAILGKCIYEINEWLGKMLEEVKSITLSSKREGPGFLLFHKGELVWDHPLSTYAKFAEKLTFLTL